MSSLLLTHFLFLLCPCIVAAVGTAGELSFREANEGTPQPSSSPQYGHLWPFSEVSLWYGKIPIVLMAEDEGLVMAAEADGRRKNYNTGHKYLLLRAFRAQGFLKVRKVSLRTALHARMHARTSLPCWLSCSSYLCYVILPSCFVVCQFPLSRTCSCRQLCAFQ